MYKILHNYLFFHKVTKINLGNKEVILKNLYYNYFGKNDNKVIIELMNLKIIIMIIFISSIIQI